MMAFKVLGLAFRDIWQELWTILIVNVLFLLANLLVITGPPAILALFFYGNRIAHGESATERDFLRAMRQYWTPAWRWGLINFLAIGILTIDYFLIERVVVSPNTAAILQGLYITLLTVWLLVQLFTLPFLFEQEQPSVTRALRNAVLFIRKNLFFALALAALLVLSLAAGTLVFMLSIAFGGALVAFASNHAVLTDLPNR
jgi:uncharacterized membrane protein YesL